MFDIHVVSVFVATLVMMAVGSLWYSPTIFGQMWMSAIGLSPESILGKRAALRMVVGGVIQFGVFYVLAHGIAFAEMVGGVSPIVAAGWAALLVSAALAGNVFWERKSAAYLWINVGYIPLSFVGTAIIITYWPW